MDRIIILSLLGILLTGCFSPKEQVSYLTWSTRGESYPPLTLEPPEQIMKEQDFPLAGTVSHHLLAGEYIDSFFKDLSRLRKVKNFLILSPRHWYMGKYSISLTDGAWLTAEGAVSSQYKTVKKLSSRLGVGLDQDLFHYEHGVSVFAPFIQKYFPGARITALAYPGEPPVNTLFLNELQRAILPLLTRDTFLLISTDFSHHGNPGETKERDDISRLFLENPKPDNWVFSGCDNRPGMYILSQLFEGKPHRRLIIRHHTNSYKISGQDKEDITSYFFTFVVE